MLISIKKINSAIILLAAILIISCGNSNTKVTTIQIFPDTIQLKKIPIGDSVKVEFQVKNTGKNYLILHKVNPSCSCSDIVFDTTPLAALQSTIVKFIYHNINDTSYPISRMFILEANTKEILHPIYFKIY